MADIYTSDKETVGTMSSRDRYVIEQDGKVRLITREEVALGEKGIIAAWLNDRGELILQVGGKED